MSRFYNLFGVATPFDPTNRFQTSYILSPFAVAIIRLIISLYAFVTLVYKLASSGPRGEKNVNRHWSYFTNISYWSMAFYFLFAGFHGVMYSRSGIAPLQRWPRPLQLLHRILHTTIITFPLLVTVVYWVLLAPDESPFSSVYTSWSNISTHALNTIFALFEIFVTRIERPPWMHMVSLILFLALYLGLAYVTYATQGFYTYGFLNPAKGIGSLLGYVFGIFAASCVIFAIVWLLVWFREWIATRLHLEGKLVGPDTGSTRSTESSKQALMVNLEMGHV